MVVVVEVSGSFGQNRFLREVSSFFLMSNVMVFLLYHATNPILQYLLGERGGRDGCEK